MFATKLNLFSIKTIEIPTYIKPISKIYFIPNLRIT
jgi:hypothetical protein